MTHEKKVIYIISTPEADVDDDAPACPGKVTTAVKFEA